MFFFFFKREETFKTYSFFIEMVYSNNRFAYLDGRIWQKRSWPVVSSSFSFSSDVPRRLIDEYKLNILNGLTFLTFATSQTRTIIFRLLLYTEFIVLYTRIETDRGGEWWSLVVITIGFGTGYMSFWLRIRKRQT